MLEDEFVVVVDDTLKDVRENEIEVLVDARAQNCSMRLSAEANSPAQPSRMHFMTRPGKVLLGMLCRESADVQLDDQIERTLCRSSLL